jgi:1,4-alpha-glucan branching enzyme
MAKIPVHFVYQTGLDRAIFRNVKLVGSWDGRGVYSSQWSSVPMHDAKGDDGCPAFTAAVAFDDSQLGYAFRWGVVLDSPAGANLWGIATEVNDPNSSDRVRIFRLLSARALGGKPQQERYDLTFCRRLGAQKFLPADAAEPALRFAVWAPQAKAVSVVFASWNGGYIDNQGGGADDKIKSLPLHRATRSGENDDPDWNGIWESNSVDSMKLADYASWDHTPYMFKVQRDDGATAYRTDLYSRCQIGAGTTDPHGQPYQGTYHDLDGRVSCSVVVDPDTVTRVLKPAEWPEDKPLFIPQEQFWQDEFDHNRPVPTSLDQVVIYELHVGALGLNHAGPGTYDDAMDLLVNHLVPLGVNAVELLPVVEFGGKDEWGYGDTHYFALEFRSGGRDQFKHFVKRCHQLGIAVILDVVYNHFAGDAERAEYQYDSAAPDRDSYYWYEGRPGDYPRPDGGYIDNGSTGRLPRLWEETVRKMFISSAAALIEEFHVDGFRVDLTQALHRDNVRHADGVPVPNANQFGAKFLREWSRTLKMIRPSTFLIAEDHTKWSMVTRPPDVGGLGFDAAWYVDFYHHLVGTVGEGPEWAKLISLAGLGGDAPLNLDWFAGALAGSAGRKVVYHISHDEAGNSGKDDPDPNKHSHRTIVDAVHGAPLVGPTRSFAEARCRFAFGMAILSPGTPMFLMGEEVGAAKDYTYDSYLADREDLNGMRTGSGRFLFRFYQDMIAFRQQHSALRSGNISVLYTHNQNRVLVFRLWSADERLLIVASLNNQPFASGYWFYSESLPDANWREIFNSDAAGYGGSNVGNGGGSLESRRGYAGPVVPANGFVVFQAV